MVVYLDEELEVDIVRLGRGALGLLVPPAGDEVDTLRHNTTRHQVKKHGGERPLEKRAAVVRGCSPWLRRR